MFRYTIEINLELTEEEILYLYNTISAGETHEYLIDSWGDYFGNPYVYFWRLRWNDNVDQSTVIHEHWVNKNQLKDLLSIKEIVNTDLYNKLTRKWGELINQEEDFRLKNGK